MKYKVLTNGDYIVGCGSFGGNDNEIRYFVLATEPIDEFRDEYGNYKYKWDGEKVIEAIQEPTQEQIDEKQDQEIEKLFSKNRLIVKALLIIIDQLNNVIPENNKTNKFKALIQKANQIVEEAKKP